MDQQKNKNSSLLVVILLLLVLVLGGYIVYDKVLSDKNTVPANNDTVDNQTVVNNNNNNNNNNVSDKSIESANNDAVGNQPVVNNNNNVILQNKEEITIEDITVKVENGNIKFTSGSKEKMFTSVNAKYIFLVSYMDSANTRLYYITNNNKLYYKNLFPFASNTFFDKEITDYGIKLTDNVVGFIGNQTANKYDSEGKAIESYPILTVLLSNGTTYSVCYAS